MRKRSIERPMILGGAGFLGSWVRREYQNIDVQPFVVDNFSNSSPDPSSPITLEGDVLEIDLDGLLGDVAPDAIFHFASAAYVPPSVEDPLTDLNKNLVTTVRVLEAARWAQSPPIVILASSAAIYGEASSLPIDEGHPAMPVSPYGASKLAAESYLSLYARIHGVPAVSVRLFSLYGPGQRKQVVHDLLRRAVDGEDPLRVLGRADATRDLVFVRDAARALITLAANAEGRGEAYNIASGLPTSVERLAMEIARLADLRQTPTFESEQRPGDPLHWHGDAAAARALGVMLDTSLADGLEETIEWMLAVDTVT